MNSVNRGELLARTHLVIATPYPVSGTGPALIRGWQSRRRSDGRIVKARAAESGDRRNEMPSPARGGRGMTG